LICRNIPGDKIGFVLQKCAKPGCFGNARLLNAFIYIRRQRPVRPANGHARRCGGGKYIAAKGVIDLQTGEC
jgi:hypothetical protein